MFSAFRVLETLRADEGLDERPAVGIGITLLAEAGEDGGAGDEGRNESERKGELNKPLVKILKNSSNAGQL